MRRRDERLLDDEWEQILCILHIRIFEHFSKTLESLNDIAAGFDDTVGIKDETPGSGEVEDMIAPYVTSPPTQRHLALL